jgi:predicted dehydrogenase
MGGDIRVVLIGAGRAGLVHGRNFAAGVRGARLVGVCDPDDATREAALAELDCDRSFSDPIEAVTDDDVDAVVVASPTFTHAKVTVAALEAGTHVLCEKPLARTLKEVSAIAEAEIRSSGTLLMGFMRRFDDGFVRAAERIAAGDIGEPLLVRSTTRGPGLPPEWAWEPDGSRESARTSSAVRRSHIGCPPLRTGSIAGPSAAPRPVPARSLHRLPSP